MVGNILGIAFTALIVIAFVWGVLIDGIIDSVKLRKRNKEFREQNSLVGRLRLRCLDCKYCQKYTYHPFYKYGPYGNYMTSLLPRYCRRFKKPLKKETGTRCIARLAEQAMWEDAPEEVKIGGHK